MRIGFTELAVVFLVALFVVGPDKLPAYAKKFGEALAQFRKASEEAAKGIKESVVEPLEEAQKPLKEAMEPFEDLDRTVRGNVKDVQKSLADIGKPGKKKEPEEEPSEERQTADAIKENGCEAVQQISETLQRKEEGI